MKIIYLNISDISLEDGWDVVLRILVSTEHIEKASLDKKQIHINHEFEREKLFSVLLFLYFQSYLSTSSIPNHDKFLMESHCHDDTDCFPAQF